MFCLLYYNSKTYCISWDLYSHTQRTCSSLLGFVCIFHFVLTLALIFSIPPCLGEYNVFLSPVLMSACSSIAQWIHSETESMPSTQNHKIHHTGRTPISALLLVVYISLVLSVGPGQHCIIKPLLLSWLMALYCFHASYVPAGRWGCQFECQIRTDFGQTTDSALMIRNWRDGVKG